jgi:hypothetical protein
MRDRPPSYTDPRSVPVALRLRQVRGRLRSGGPLNPVRLSLRPSRTIGPVRSVWKRSKAARWFLGPVFLLGFATAVSLVIAGSRFWGVLTGVVTAMVGLAGQFVYPEYEKRRSAAKDRQERWSSAVDPWPWPKLDRDTREEPRLDLLDPRRQVVPFTFRGRQVDELLRWCEDPQRLALGLVNGPAGSGKTRLAVEVARRLIGGTSSGSLELPIQGERWTH